jgi:hypothetical protein
MDSEIGKKNPKEADLPLCFALYPYLHEWFSLGLSYYFMKKVICYNNLHNLLMFSFYLPMREKDCAGNGKVGSC